MNKYNGCLIGCLGAIAGFVAFFFGIVALIWLGCYAVEHRLVEDDDSGDAIPERDKIRKMAWVSGDGDDDDQDGHDPPREVVGQEFQPHVVAGPQKGQDRVRHGHPRRHQVQRQENNPHRLHEGFL